MKKILNFRPVVFLCLLFALGIYAGLFCLTNGYLIFILFFGIGLVLLLILLAIHFFKLKKSFFTKFFKIRFFVLSSFIAVFLGFLMFNAYVTGYNAKNIEEKNYTFSAKVYGVFKQEDDYITLVLEKVSFFTDDKKEIKLKNKSLLTFGINTDDEEEFEFQAGEVINGTCGLKNFSIVNKNSINTFGIKNGYRYLLYSDNLEISGGNAGVLAFIRQSSKDVLKENMHEEIYPVAYALVFGDTSMLKSETAEAFQKTGLAHIFAVSGLHVGFLMAVLLLIFKKLKLRYRYQFVISALVLMFYAAICGFSPSVLRAALMTLIYLLSKISGRQYDGLSSLFLAALIILTFSPLYLFDAGFQLSFAAVFSIMLLNPVFNKLFKFMPAFLNSGISVSLSAQIGVLPLMAFYFNYVPVLSVLLNVLIIPVISIAFISVLILLPLSIIPYISFLFAFPQVLIEIVLFLTKSAALIPFVNLRFVFTGGFIIFYLIIVILSPVVLSKLKFKLIAVSVLSIILTANLVLFNLPKKFDGYNLIYYDMKQDIYSFTDDGNFYLVAGGNNAVNYESLTLRLKLEKIKNIKGVIIYKTTDNYMTLISEISNVCKIENIFIRESLIADDVIYMRDLKEQNINVEILYYKKPVKTGNIRLTLYGSLNLDNALYVDLYDYSVLFTGTINKGAYEYLINYVFLSPQIVLANNYGPELYNHYKPKMLLTRYQPSKINPDFYSIQACGELIFDIRNGIIKRI